MACFPAVLVFEHFRWFEGPLHLAAFCACIVAVTSAVIYLFKTRSGTGKAAKVAEKPQLDDPEIDVRASLPPVAFGVPVRALAFFAILLAGGFILFVIGVVVLLSLMPSEF